MEVSLLELWLPILIASISVFAASAIIWMLLPHHKKDIRFMPNEGEFTAAIKPLNIEPGLYMFPNCQDHKDMKGEEFQSKLSSGPWGVLTLMPAQPHFGKNLLKTYLSYLVITILIAYIAAASTRAGADYLGVFQIAGAAGILGYCMGGMANDFFLGKPTRFIVTSFLDGVVFALITAGILASMWPETGGGMPDALITP